MATARLMRIPRRARRGRYATAHSLAEARRLAERLAAGDRPWPATITGLHGATAVHLVGASWSYVAEPPWEPLGGAHMPLTVHVTPETIAFSLPGGDPIDNLWPWTVVTEARPRTRRLDIVDFEIGCDPIRIWGSPAPVLAVLAVYARTGTIIPVPAR